MALYSYLSATIGSTLVARRAGHVYGQQSHYYQQQGQGNEGPAGSLGRTPYSKPVRSRVSPRATATPMPTPIRVRRSPSPTTIRKMSRRVAPRAERMPISCLRRPDRIGKHSIDAYGGTAPERLQRTGPSMEAEDVLPPDRLRDYVLHGAHLDHRLVRCPPAARRHATAAASARRVLRQCE